MPSNSFYVTTPIYYVNDRLHIGHSYSTIAADVLARYHRLCGDRVYFLTGTDEHGIKVQRSAQALGLQPIELADRVVTDAQSLWRRLLITNDDFIRTTQPRHEHVVQYIYQRLYDTGNLLLADYSGWYCASCENFLAQDDLVEGNCPDCHKKAEVASEQSYFFRLSAYRTRLRDFLRANPDFVRPRARYNEVLSRVEEGLRDLSVSRTSLEWAIPLPFHPKHRAYVWIDALSNYISALGYPDGDLYRTFWPADLHLVGKDILWFHAVIWPCLLMALDLPFPKMIFAHGWWTHNGEKMSKSKGNFVDPNTIIDTYGVDPYRYFLLREMPFGQDGDFSETALIGRINNDLGNDLGNLLHRTLTMMEKYFGGVVPQPGPADEDSRWLASQAAETVEEFETQMADIQFNRALEAVWRLVSAANRHVEATKPWELARDRAHQARLACVMYSLAETLRLLSLLLAPFMPAKMDALRAQMGVGPAEPPFEAATQWGTLKPGTKIAKGEPLFPKILG